MVHLDDVRPGIWDVTVEYMESSLKELNFEGDDIVLNWREAANFLRRERELFEKYGFLKDLILNPVFQSWKTWIEEYFQFMFRIRFSLVLGEPLLPLVTSIIILYMMNRRIPTDIIFLIAGLFFNINPIYVVVLYVAYYYSLNWNNEKPKQYTTENANEKVFTAGIEVLKDISKSTIYDSTEHTFAMSSNDSEFDHILIGGDLSTLYTASLLSEVGHKCLVLQPENCEKLTHHPEGAPCPCPTLNLSVNNGDRYQALLDIVSKKDRRISLVPIGSPGDGFMYTAIRNVQNKIKNTNSSSLLASVWSLRVGVESFMTNLCSSTMVEAGKIQNLFSVVQNAHVSMTNFLFQKSFAGPFDNLSSGNGTLPAVEGEVSNFASLSAMSLERVLRGRTTDGAYDILTGAALSSIDESSCSAENCSAAALTQLLVSLESGIFYPVGGIETVTASFISTIQKNGKGIVLTNVPVKEIVLTKKGKKMEKEDEVLKEKAEVDNNSIESKFKVSHVALADSKNVFSNGNSVISGMGILGTFVNLLSGGSDESNKVIEYHEVATKLMKGAFSGLEETRPVMKVLFWINTNQSDLDLDLGLSAVDYVEYTSSTSIKSYSSAPVRIWSPSSKDPSWSSKYPGNEVVVLEYPAKDAHAKLRPKVTSNVESRGPSMYCKPKFMGEYTSSYEKGQKDEVIKELKTSALQKLKEIYPKAGNNVQFCDVLFPADLGTKLSFTPAKFSSSPVGAMCEDIEGLYMCGRDLGISGFAADIQGGFVAANAALGYNAQDYSDAKNVISDLRSMQTRSC